MVDDGLRIVEPAKPEKPVTVADAMRAIADWLDTYDRMAELFVQMRSSKYPVSEETQTKALEAVRGKDVQKDLRDWADILETRGMLTNEPERTCND